MELNTQRPNSATLRGKPSLKPLNKSSASVTEELNEWATNPTRPKSVSTGTVPPMYKIEERSAERTSSPAFGARSSESTERSMRQRKQEDQPDSPAVSYSTNRSLDKYSYTTLNIEHKEGEDGIMRSYLKVEPNPTETVREPSDKARSNPKIAFGARTVLTDGERTRINQTKSLPALRPPERKDAIALRDAFHISITKAQDQSNYKEQSRYIYMSCFNELYRQVAAHCQERGDLLRELWHGMIHLADSTKTRYRKTEDETGISFVESQSRIRSHEEEKERLLEINDSLRKHLTEIQKQLAARDDEDIERIKFYEQKVTLVESKCAADIKTLQDYFDELEQILEPIKDAFRELQLPFGYQNSDKIFWVKHCLKLVSALVVEYKNKIYETEKLIEKMNDEIERYQSMVRVMENRLSEEKAQKIHLDNQLQVELQKARLLEEKIAKLIYSKGDKTVQTEPANVIENFSPLWQYALTDYLARITPTIMSEARVSFLIDEIVKSMSISSTIKMQNYVEACKKQFRLLAEIDEKVSAPQMLVDFAFSVEEYKWLNGKVMAFARCSEIFQPFTKKATTDLLQKSAKWVNENFGKLVHMGDSDIKVITATGVIHFLNQFFPRMSPIGKVLLMYKAMSLGTRGALLSLQMLTDVEMMSTSRFKIPVLTPIEMAFSFIIDLDRFILLCLEEMDEPHASEDITASVFRAASVIRVGVLEPIEFRSLIRLTNQSIPDSQADLIFREFVTETQKDLSLELLQVIEKKYKLIFHVPMVGSASLRQSPTWGEMDEYWRCNQDELKEALGTVQALCNTHQLDKQEFNVLYHRIEAYQKVR
eukprot:TRINITY_DN8947_c0_g1_i3.p1 TRINITY_DN8947_c0_g1~~TRINITY_DN8947_c0_g1_i3.p1  ORF type:complete len:824 (-),score=138.45 TRINITY_DN8947_c0_g1_i3:42-2513(-)